MDIASLESIMVELIDCTTRGGSFKTAIELCLDTNYKIAKKYLEEKTNALPDETQVSQLLISDTNSINPDALITGQITHADPYSSSITNVTYDKFMETISPIEITKSEKESELIEKQYSTTSMSITSDRTGQIINNPPFGDSCTMQFYPPQQVKKVKSNDIETPDVTNKP